jgi:PAS domain S-box-containing protein
MKLDLKLSQKGWILVSVPLAFELIFVITLAFLVRQAEDLAAREKHSKAIIDRANDLAMTYYELIQGIAVYTITGKKERGQQYEDMKSALLTEYKSLTLMVRNNPTQAAEVQQMSELAFKILSRMDQVKKAVDERGKSAALLVLAQTRAQMEKAGAILVGQLRQFSAKEQNSMVTPEAGIRSTFLVKLCLCIGVVFNILVAAALALYFNRGTAQRLGILMDNTNRLARNEALHAPIPGSDEIAHLDRTFRDMVAALAEARRKETAVIDHAVDVICSIDATGRFAAVNPASLKTLGYEPQELIGRLYMELIYPEDRQNTFRQIEEIKTGNGTSSFENRINRKDGQIVDVEWSCHWSESESSMFSVVHDITERKEVERLKQEFVAMVSHDLRTPLTSLQGTLALIRKGTYGSLSEQGQARVINAEKNVLRLINLINELLELEKLEAGKLTMQFGNCQIASVITRSLDSVQSFAEQAEIELEAAQCKAVVYADEDKLIQVLVNLLSNAVKFSPPGGKVAITVTEDERSVELSVTDHGRGIPAKFKDAVFQKFKQVELSDERKKGGTGLGLAICKAIVEQHGGTIGVESEEGKGSTFWFRLPKGKTA